MISWVTVCSLLCCPNFVIFLWIRAVRVLKWLSSERISWFSILKRSRGQLAVKSWTRTQQVSTKVPCISLVVLAPNLRPFLTSWRCPRPEYLDFLQDLLAHYSSHGCPIQVHFLWIRIVLNLRLLICQRIPLHFAVHTEVQSRPSFCSSMLSKIGKHWFSRLFPCRSFA